MSKFITKKAIFDIDKNSALAPQSLQMLEEASICLGKLNQFSTDLFEFDFILEAMRNIEALNSAKIEGTTGNLGDLYMQDSLDYEIKKKLKLFSAINYKNSINELEQIYTSYNKIDKSLIRNLHKILTENDPSTSGTSGKFREKEVKIQNSKLGDFYPANPVNVDEFIDQMIQDLNSCELPKLIGVAIMHYQFEAIHPFEDGNGRSGRLLITAKLLLDNIISQPILNLSQYLEGHRDEYITALRSVSVESSFEKWITFFLEAIIQQCQHNLKIIDEMRMMKNRDESLIRETIKSSPVASHVLKFALNKLFVTVPEVSKHLKELKVPLADYEQTARINVNRLTKMRILTPTETKRGRAQIFVHKELFKMLTR